MEGFTLKTIPERKYKSCSGCVYHRRLMFRSGRDPIYMNNCNNPDIPDEHRNILGLGTRYGNIGDNDITPNWCPFLQKQET